MDTFNKKLVAKQKTCIATETRKIDLRYDSAIPLLSIRMQDTEVKATRPCLLQYLSQQPRSRNQPKCPWADERIKM